MFAWKARVFSEKQALCQPIRWFELGKPEALPEDVVDWLYEKGSMTSRFEQYCHYVTVVPQCEQFVSSDSLTSDEIAQLPVSDRYWLREIVLYGDGHPWLLGRTLIPEETLTGSDLALLDLGTLPLGRYLFNHPYLSRDYIQAGIQGKLWARRSRLRLASKPLLLTEVFLQESPLYTQGTSTCRSATNE